jgi:eukaryotic-like serine/threonine-protein kinase
VNEHADDDRLLAIAQAICDGRGVNWHDVDPTDTEGGQADVIRELRVLQHISTVIASSKQWEGIELGEIIGQGVFGTVYRGFDTALQRHVAVKIADADDGKVFDPERAVSEARLLAKVGHPNVVSVFGAQRRDNAVALVMELVEGDTLQEIVSRQGPLSANEAGLIGLDLCRALAAVHGAGLLHGDVKAHNVMRATGGRIVLMDFGAGRSLSDRVAPAADMVGTPLYLAPEVFQEQGRTPASDIYSLGVLLFYLVTASYPVAGGTRTEVRHTHVNGGTRVRLRDARPDLPETFIAIVERTLAIDPAQRFQTAGELEAALSAALSKRDTRETKTRTITAKRPFVALMAAGGVLALIAVAVAARGAFFGPASGAASSTSTVLSPTATYRVEAAMYRVDPSGGRQKLRAGESITVGDRLYLQLSASSPVHVYVVNEDERGSSTVLFPLAGFTKGPLPAAQSTLPGVQGQREIYWQVSTPGEREYFLIFASLEPLTELEHIIASLPRATFNADSVSNPPIPRDLEARLRGVGGLVAGATTRLHTRYMTPLADTAEEVSGLWVRQIAFVNARK